MELKELFCKCCTAPLDPAKATGRVIRCEHCGTAFVLAREDDGKVVDLLRSGELLLDTCKFDDAYAAYQKAAELDKEEPEAYFGMALAKFKVQYLKDETSDPPRLQPICHEISEKKFTDDKNYQHALGLATREQREAYAAKGAEIDAIRKEFYALKQAGTRYDCFLCVKVSDEHGGTTQDSHAALRLYNHLKSRGFSPFYSEEEARERTGSAYEALILYALYTSGCMLIVCSNEDYLQTKWVKNEYMRFSKMIAQEEKGSNAITFVYKGTPIERLPGRDWKLQGIDLSKPDAYSRIEEYVQRCTATAAPAEIKRKEYGTVSYVRKNVQRQGITKRELTMVNGGEISVSDRSKLNIATEFLHRGDFANALRFLDNMIRENPGNGEAYFLRFLAENSCHDEDSFVSAKAEARDFDNFEKAISATQDAGRRMAFYRVLYRHIAETKDLDAYNEYIVLPESEEKHIAELADNLYHEAVKRRDAEMFNAVVKTVTDTDRYISMNLEFAHAVSGKAALPYYKNILEADAGHGEALYVVYYFGHGGNDEAVFDYCSAEGKAADMEEKLFAYGYNSYAEEKLFALCLKFVQGKPDNACRLFDFLLTMIPKKADTQFKEYLINFLYALFRAAYPSYAKKYNELLLAQDKLNDGAYFNRVLIKHNYYNPLQLIEISRHLLDDEDYFSAVNSYAERHPEGNNLYLTINDALIKLSEEFKDAEIRKLIVEKVYVPAAMLQNCTDDIYRHLGAEADRCLHEVLKEHRCTALSELMDLREDITGNEHLKRAYKFAVASKSDLASKLNIIMTNQARASQHNVEHDKEEARIVKKSNACKNAILIIGLLAIFSGCSAVGTWIYGLCEEIIPFGSNLGWSIFGMIGILAVTGVAIPIMAAKEKSSTTLTLITILATILFGVLMIIVFVGLL